jgi:hypothetical protein
MLMRGDGGAVRRQDGLDDQECGGGRHGGTAVLEYRDRLLVIQAMEYRLHHVDIPALGHRRQEVVTEYFTGYSQALGCEERCGLVNDGGQVGQHAFDVGMLRLELCLTHRDQLQPLQPHQRSVRGHNRGDPFLPDHCRSENAVRVVIGWVVTASPPSTGSSTPVTQRASSLAR